MLRNGEEAKADGQPSRVWILKTNEHGTRARKELAYTYTSGEDSPNDYMYPIGIVFDHGEPLVHVGGSPAREWAANPIMFNMDISDLEGRLLTLTDASFSDKQQREAFKSLVRQTVWRWNGDKERRVQEVFEYTRLDEESEKE